MANTNAGASSAVTANNQSLLTSQAKRLIGKALAVNLNLTGDTVVPVLCSATWAPIDCIVTNASVSMTTAHISVYPQPGAAGTAIVSDVGLTANSAATVVNQLTINTSATQTIQNFFVRC